MKRETRETQVEALWKPAGRRKISVATGIPFFDHMLTQWAFHGVFDLEVSAKGDLLVDAHHTIEDTAIALGEAIQEALKDREGIARFGWAYAPLDEALSRVVVDLVRRPHASIRLPALPAALGTMPGEMVPHFFRSLAMAGRFTLHVDVLQGENSHHMVESAFKALGLAMKQAVRPEGAGAPSTKGKA